MTTKICLSIIENESAQALLAAQQAEGLADVIEIRLDSLPDPEPTLFVNQLKSPVLFTNRPEWEGGLYHGDEQVRIALLKQALAAGASFIDIELRTKSSLRREIIDLAGKSSCQTIVSWHDFQETPGANQLENILHEQMNSGADIGKMVTMAYDFQDVLRVLALQTMAHEKKFPLIAFCMGGAGRISRLATFDLGGYMSYAALDSGKAAAPGQISVSRMRELLKMIHYHDEN